MKHNINILDGNQLSKELKIEENTVEVEDTAVWLPIPSTSSDTSNVQFSNMHDCTINIYNSQR